MDNEDAILHQMEDTRTSLTDKLETLEKKVADTVQGATTNVASTVEAVKDSVQDTVTSVKDRVKETFDVPEHIRHRPWAAVAGATVVGVVAGYALSQNGNKPKTQSAQRTTAAGNGQTPRPAVFSAPVQPGTTR